MYTPWGKADYITQLELGISNVETPSHGGLMITKGYAMRNLSRSAIDRGEPYGDYYAYEEDCDWAIPIFELRHLWPDFFKHSSKLAYNPLKQYDYMWKSLSAWHADYLLETGIKPSPSEYTGYKQRHLEDEMRQQHHPSLIVSACGEWYTKRPGVVMVTTADGKEYYITSKSYSAAREKGRLLLIEDMEIVKG